MPVKITWLHNNKTITNREGLSTVRGKKYSTLNLESVSFEDAGEYTCIAENRAGMANYSAFLNVNGISV